MSNLKVIGVDIGNSSVKTGEFFSSDIGEVQRWDSVEAVMKAFKDAFFLISTVRKPDLAGSNVHYLGHQTPLPIKLNYGTPETLGADRIAAAVGAWQLFTDQNILIIDSGTCITYDIVSSEGVYQGGVIAPGLEMRLRAMHEFTARLPKVEPGAPQSPGKTTIECMQLGASEAMKHEIEGFLVSFNKKFPDLQVVTTGGLLPDFESQSKKHIFASSKIVLSGLHAIWKYNEGTKTPLFSGATH